MKAILAVLLLLCFGCNNEQQKTTRTQSKDTITDIVINKPIQPQYINAKEVKGWDLEKIKQKYKPITEEEFLLNKGPISEFRVGLYNIFNKKERKQPIPIKEVTWEKDSLTNYTIWFKKDTIWKSVDTLSWSKGAEF